MSGSGHTFDWLPSMGPLIMGCQSTSTHAPHGWMSLLGQTRIAGKRFPPSTRTILLTPLPDTRCPSQGWEAYHRDRENISFIMIS